MNCEEVFHKRDILFFIQGGNILSKCIEKRRDDLLGKEFETNNSGKCFIIDYKGSHDITVMFYDPVFITTCQQGQLYAGRVKNPYVPSLYGKGYVGVGVNSVTDKKTFQFWCGILERAYNPKYVKKNPTYVGTTVCDEWLNFQNFAAWCYKQKGFKVKDERGLYFQLDKDLLVKGNKCYSPDTCCFVPQAVNKLLLKSNKSRGEMPIGVFNRKGSNSFTASMSRGSDKKVTIGSFKNPEDAFQAYKVVKEGHIKSVAEKWKGLIDCRAYEALMNYNVEISD